MKFNNSLPYAILFYYAKGWISYKHTHPDWDIKRQIKDIIEKCQYISVGNPTSQLLHIFEYILEWCREYNRQTGENVIRISRYVESIAAWESEVASKSRIYDCPRDEAIIYTIISEISMIPVGKMNIKPQPLKYDRKSQFRISTWHQGMTYKEMQKRFDKSWNIIAD